MTHAPFNTPTHCTLVLRRTTILTCCVITALLCVLAGTALITPATAQPQCARSYPADDEHLLHQAAFADTYRDSHQFATGEGITVAVIDTGVAPHPRLPMLDDGGDLVRGDHPDTPDTPPAPGALIDCDAHGTIVAGVIAGRWASDEIVGVAPNARILSIKQTSAKAHSDHNAGSLGSLVAAIDSAIDQGAQVINISVVSCIPPHTRLDTSSLDSVLLKAERHNVVIVAAAGNTGNDCPEGSWVLPAHAGTVIAVASLADNYHHTPYTVAAPKEVIAAPGTVFAALDPFGSGLAAGTINGSSVAPFEGTSFAAPVVAGTVALLKQLHPQASAAQLRSVLFASVDPSVGTLDVNRTVRYSLSNATRYDPDPIPLQPPVVQHSELSTRAGYVSVVLVAALATGLALIGIRQRKKQQ
ncbi:MAG: S8 family serine peptidase [Corynebacterium sp.]|nr:S8 family serine peptidase [Corynebacterium sp.]